jgi:hypothetical protein
MSSSRACVAALIALAAACTDSSGDEQPAQPTTSTTEQAITQRNLDVEEVRTWNFDGPLQNGIDPRFDRGKVKAAKNVSFKHGPSQQITLTATNENDGGKPAQADISLVIADIPVTGNGDHYYKGWLEGTATDSDNAAIGFCGSGNFDKGEFHVQLQMAFLGAKGGGGLCYCNLCPAQDGHDVWCATDQWQVPVADPPKVSGTGACKAPAGTTHVVVTLEAVAKGDTKVHHHGTAVFRKVAFGRCHDDGFCPPSMTPNDYGK